MNISLKCLDMHFPDVFCLNRCSAKEKNNVSWSNQFGKYSKGNMEGFLIAGLTRTFILLICVVNFQEVKTSMQLGLKHFLTVESVFMVHLVGLEILGLVLR